MPCHVDPSYRVIYRYFAKLMHLIIEMHTLPSHTTVIEKKTKGLFQTTDSFITYLQFYLQKKKKGPGNIF